MKRIVHLAKRASPLLRLASEYTAAHMGTRILAALSGLMLVRLLPVNEYGFYTLGLTAFSFICVFSDLGATETLSFFRWRARKKNKSWVPYFHAVMRFRRTVFLFGFITSAAYIFYTSRHFGEDTPTILAGIVLMGLSAWFAIQSGIISFVLKLEQHFRLVYLVELSNEAIKLLSVSMIWMLGFSTALAGMSSIAFGSVAAAALAFGLLRKNKVLNVRPSTQGSRRTNRVLMGQIVPTFPGAIHFAIQGLLVTWLAAYYGTVVNVAEVGALGRLGVIISVISGFTGSVFVPRLIAITDETLFFKRYLLWWLIMAVLGGAILLAVWIFQKEFLYLLGGSYSGLHEELLISSLTAVIGTWGGFAWNINRARGWIKFQPYSVAVIGLGQVVMFFIIDLSDTEGVLLFGMGTVLLGAVYQIFQNAIGFNKATYVP